MTFSSSLSRTEEVDYGSDPRLGSGKVRVTIRQRTRDKRTLVGGGGEETLESKTD